jgi:hypothetical protein
VLGAQPRGLQLRDIHTAKRLRWELLEVDLHGAWAELLPKIVREPGRPKRLVDSDDFNRFWRADSSDTGVDRRIMKLYRTHQDTYDRLVARTITWAQAIQEAGLERPRKDRLLHDLMSAWNRADPGTQETFFDCINRFRAGRSSSLARS